MPNRRTSVVLLAVAVAAAPEVARALDLYVDGALSAPCATYDVATRACGSGTAEAFDALVGAASAAMPGDVVLVRGGTYGEQLAPARSGEAGRPITYRAMDGEVAVIAGVSEPALALTGVSYVVVEGLAVRDVLGFGRLEDVSHVVIRGVTFERATATGTTGGLKLVRATDSVVEGCSLVDGNDNLEMQESDRNRIENNRFAQGRHSLLSVRCSSDNVFRGNSFENAAQKAMEIYDCEGTSDAPVRYDATHRNVIEQNVFSLTLGSDAPHRYNAIQYAGQDGIVRRNVFYDNAGGGLNFQVYADEALVNYGHRAYHNTFVDNRCYALASSNDVSAEFRDNLVRNNLFFRNVGCAGELSQTAVGNPVAVALSDNLEAAADPGLVDLAAHDYQLTATSSAIDAAAFLTAAVGAGSGTRLPVVDVAYFHAAGVPEGDLGDLVQLAGDTMRVRVIDIDRGARVLVLGAPLTWTDAQGVSLAYESVAPDVGAFERGLVVPGPTGDGGVVPRSDGGGSAGADAATAARDGGASPGPDGGSPPPAGGDDAGCGCVLASRPTPLRVSATLVAAFVAFGAVRARRRTADARRRATDA